MSPHPSTRGREPSRDRRHAKLPLVYILSTGRSGSTLLDVLLGAQPECWTLGEFQLLDLGMGRQMPCGCGKPLGHCDFWGPVAARVRRTIRFPLGHFRSGAHPNGKVVRWPMLLSIIKGRPPAAERSAAHAYGISNLAAMDEARFAAERQRDRVSWLIDASKDPYRLFWLEASGHFDIRVIHLVRRPQGFVANMMRSAGVSGPVAVLKYAGRWMVENAIALGLCRRMFHSGMVKTVHYEDLASDPGAVIGEVCRWLKVPFDADRTGNTGIEVNHGVGGNRPRWEALDVTFEETWRITMPKFQQRLVSLVTSPFFALQRRRTEDDRPSRPKRFGRRRGQTPWLAGSS